MALLRDHEDNGFGPLHDAIETGQFSRVEAAIEVLTSEEYLAILAAD
jgi:hypothetical protein